MDNAFPPRLIQMSGAKLWVSKPVYSTVLPRHSPNADCFSSGKLCSQPQLSFSPMRLILGNFALISANSLFPAVSITCPVIIYRAENCSETCVCNVDSNSGYREKRLWRRNSWSNNVPASLVQKPRHYRWGTVKKALMVCLYRSLTIKRRKTLSRQSLT